eukprot:1559_1
MDENEVKCMMALSVLTLCIVSANGFSLGLPDSINFLYYLNSNLGGHIDYPFYSKMVILYKLFESKSGGKPFGWCHSGHLAGENQYKFEQLVMRHLKVGGCVGFFCNGSMKWNHGVGDVDGDASMLSHRWKSLLYKSNK